MFLFFVNVKDHVGFEPSTLTKSRYYWYRYFKSRYQIPYRAESARIGKCRSNKIPVPIIPGFRHSVDGKVRDFFII